MFILALPNFPLFYFIFIFSFAYFREILFMLYEEGVWWIVSSIATVSPLPSYSIKTGPTSSKDLPVANKMRRFKASLSFTIFTHINLFFANWVKLTCYEDLHLLKLWLAHPIASPALVSPSIKPGHRGHGKHRGVRYCSLSKKSDWHYITL